MDSDEKLPTPLNPNERNVYLNEPPLPVEFSQGENGKILVKKCLDEAMAIPVGAILTHVNDEELVTQFAEDTLNSLHKWNNPETEDKISLILRFFVIPEAPTIAPPIPLAEDGGDPVRNIFIRDISQKARSKLGVDLGIPFIRHLCSINSWDRNVVVPLLDRLIEDFLQMSAVRPFWLAAESDSVTIGQNGESDLLDGLSNIIAKSDSASSGCGGSSEGDYVVSLVSRQLGMTIENVFERTIVRSIHPNSEAFKLNVKTNSVILNIGSSSTMYQTHLETLEALKNTVRPVKLRMCQLDSNLLSRYRVEMQSLVQRQKTAHVETTTVLSIVERQLLWVLEMYAFAESVQAGRMLQRLQQGEGGSVGSNVDSGLGASTVNEELVELLTPKRCSDRAIKALVTYEASRRAFADNERKEALVQMRLSAISEVMYEIRDVFDWRSGRLQAALAAGERDTAAESKYDDDASPADMLNAALRSICYKLLHLTNDQQTDLQQIFPDRATCDVLDRLVNNSLTEEVIRLQHVPALWKLAGSVSVAARIACANLVPLMFNSLSELQKLRIRGLVNRLMVDSVGAVRAYVLSSVCVRILRSVVQRPSGDHSDDRTLIDSSASITLNWIAHCMVLGSTDIELDVRKGALQSCKNLIEYSALGADDVVSLEKNVDLVEEMQTYISEDISPPTFNPDMVLRPPIGDVHIMFCRVLPIISRLVEDNLADIRGSVVSMMGDFCIWMGGKWSAILLDVLLCCFRDAVPEVRAAALSAVPHAVLALIQAAIKADKGPRDHAISKLFISLIPAVCSMHKDVSVPVRVALCTCLSRVLSLVYSVTMNGQLSSYSFMPRLEANMCDVVLLLLEDKSMQVCTQMIVELAMSVDKEYQHGYSSYTSAVFTVKNSGALIRSVTLLSKQSTWRVRRRVCAVIPKLVACCTTVEKRSAISDVVQPLLYDAVFDVRKAAARAMCLAAECDGDASGLALNGQVTPEGEPLQDMGRMWLDCVVLPQLEALRTSRVFSNRILSLHMIATIIIEDIVHEGDVRYDILVNIAITLAADPIPNVRIALCEVLVVLAPLLRQGSMLYEAATSSSIDAPKVLSAYHHSQSSLPDKVRSAIASLQQDIDRDVRHLASKAGEFMDSASSPGAEERMALFRKKSRELRNGSDPVPAVEKRA